MASRVLAALLLAAAPAAASAGVPGDFVPAAPPAIAWPAGPGKALVETRCLICHGGEIVATQRLTAAQWDREVEKMAGWGAPLAPEERRVLAAYLAAHFGPAVPGASPAAYRLVAPR
jgi:cytochrome c5